MSRTHGKDIMLLCKGWYNKEKYPTLKDALIAYYHKNYGCKDITPDYSFINQVLLQPACEELVTMHPMYTRRLIDFIFKYTDIFSLPKDKNTSYSEELYFRITEFFGTGFITKHTKNNYIIDTSGYWLLDESGNEIIVDGHSILAEDIV